MDETLLYHYDLETKQQSMEWRHSGSPRPKIIREQKSAGKVLACFDFLGSRRFFGIKTAFSSLIILQKAKLSTRSITYLCLCNWRTFWRKNASCGKVLFLHDKAPAYRALATQKKLSYLSFQCLDHPPYSPDLAPSDYHPFTVLITHPILRIWPRRTTTRSLDWRNNWKDATFVRRRGHCCRGDVVGRTTFGFFFEWLAKVRATG